MPLILMLLLFLAGCSEGDEITVFPPSGGEQQVIIVHEPSEVDCPPHGRGHGRGPCR